MHPKIKRSNERGWYVLRKRRMLSEQGGLADPVPDEEELPPSFDLRQNARNAARKRLSAVVLPATKGDVRGVKRKAGAQRPQASPNTSPRKEVEVVIPLPRGWSRVPRGSTAGPVEEAGPSSRMLRARNTQRASTDESDLDTDGESEYRGGETDHEDSDSARENGQDEDDEVNSIVPEQEDDGVDKKRKYRSKQREMHRALDGSALLAIGEQRVTHAFRIGADARYPSRGAYSGAAASGGILVRARGRRARRQSRRIHSARGRRPL